MPFLEGKNGQRQAWVRDIKEAGKQKIEYIKTIVFSRATKTSKLEFRGANVIVGFPSTCITLKAKKNSMLLINDSFIVLLK